MIPNYYPIEHKKDTKLSNSFDVERKFFCRKHMITNGFFFASNRSNASQLVPLYLDSKPITVLCQMGNFGCGGGGWTPVMKINGSQVSLIWRNILGGVFLRVMKREQDIFRSIETTRESLSNSSIFPSRSRLRKFFWHKYDNTQISKSATNC